MTNSSKKTPAKNTARDKLDLDLDARLDEATSTLPLDEEPPSGDALDQMLKRAKKVLDAQLSPEEQVMAQEAQDIAQAPEKPTKSKRKNAKTALETPEVPQVPVDDTSQNKLVSFNDTLAKIEEDIAALQTEQKPDALQDTAVMDAHLNGKIEDISTHLDDILDDVVELDTVVSQDELRDLLSDSHDDAPIVEDLAPEVLDDILGLDTPVDDSALDALLGHAHDDIPVIDAPPPEALDDSLNLDTPVDDSALDALLGDAHDDIPVIDATPPEALDDSLDLDTPVDEAALDALLGDAHDDVSVIDATPPEALDDSLNLDTPVDDSALDALLGDAHDDIPVIDATPPEALDDSHDLDTPVDDSALDALLGDAHDDIPVIDATPPEALDDSLDLDTPLDESELDALLTSTDATHDVFDEIVDLESPALDENVESLENSTTNLDALLDDTAFDFDFDLLLDEISDELKAEISDESSTSETHTDAISLAPENHETNDDAKTVELVEQPEEDENTLKVDINAALDDLMDSVPFEDILNVTPQNEFPTEQEEFNNFDDVADTEANTLVEMSTSEQFLDDNFDELPQLEGLNDTMENKNDTASGFDLLDDNADNKASAMPANGADDLDWLDEMTQESSDNKKTDDVAADDGDGWITSDDDGDDGWITSDEDTAASSVNLSKDTSTSDNAADEGDGDGWITSDDDDGWITGDEEEASSSSVNLNKDTSATDNAADDDDGWMTSDDDSATSTQDATPPPAPASQEAPVKMSKEPAIAPAVAAFDESALIAKVKEELKGEKDHELARLRADQDKVEAHAKKQFAGLEDAKKKNTKLSYIALGVGIIGLMGSGGVGWMAYNSKNEEIAINEHVTQLDEKINNFLAKNPEKEIENIKNSVEQLNQKIDKLTSAQITPPVSNVIAPSIVPEIAPTTETETLPPVAEPVVAKPEAKAEVKKEKDDAKHSSKSKEKAEKAKEDAKPTTESKAPKVEKNDSPVNLLNSKASSEKPKIEDVAPAVIPELNPVMPELAETAKKAPEKPAESAKPTESTKEPAKTQATSQQSDASATPVKVETFDSILKESPYTGRMTRGMAFGREKEKGEKHQASHKPHREIAETAIAEPKPASAGKFSVNVVSYQQEWFAQSKAAELRQQGIPVEVAPVDVNDAGTRYRLKVTGFKTKGEANAYANKVKKSSGFNDSWVGVND